MSRRPQPVTRLIGALLTQGADWSLSEFAALFERLGGAGRGTGTNRFVRYYGGANGQPDVRFFGMEVDRIESIPEDMVALELYEDRIMVLAPTGLGPAPIWSSNLAWSWLDRAVEGRPVGDFKARIPSFWALPRCQQTAEFVLSANSYSEEGRATDDDVRIVEYDPGWPARFEEKAQEIRRILPRDAAPRIEHFGSTAIAGMDAKPVIDILVEIPSFSEGRRKLIPALNKPECEYWWYDDHMMFVVRNEMMGTRTHHIHAAPAGHRFWEGVAFRDYLRANPDDAVRYANIKRELAVKHPTDREEYTALKRDFVLEITEKALQLGY